MAQAAAPRLPAPHLSQGDGGHVGEVVAGPFEPRVGFLLDNEGDVRWNDIGTLKAKGKKKKGNWRCYSFVQGKVTRAPAPFGAAGWGEKKGIFFI